MDRPTFFNPFALVLARNGALDVRERVCYDYLR